MDIITHTPIWVWGLLAGLVAIGGHAMVDRRAPAWAMAFLPFLVILPLRGLNEMGATGIAFALFGMAWVAGIKCGRALQPRYIGALSGRGLSASVTLRGEPMTMALILAIFFANYTREVLQATAPAIAAGSVFQFVFAVVTGFAAGIFAGRAWAVLALRAPSSARAGNVGVL